MSEIHISPEQMAKRLARFAELKPYKDTLNDAHGIPAEAMRMMSPDKVYPIMSPEGWTGRSRIAPVKGAPGLSITLVECPPGDHAGLHKHTDSVENFFCIAGSFEIVWGAQAEHRFVLDALDFISIPAGVYRDFRNVGSTIGRLLVRADRSVDLSAYMAAWKARVKPRGALRLTIDIDPYSFL